MRVRIIVNRAAGGGRGGDRFERLKDLLPWPHADREIVWTEAPGHATDLARDAVAHGTPIVVAVGGDGTASEVANALVDQPVAMAVVPTGTGCDLVRSLGLPTKPAQAAQALGRCVERRIDVGRMGDRYFVNAAGLGFDAAVAQEVDRLKARTRATGTWPYLLALSKVLRTYTGPDVTTEADGARLSGPVLLITLANGRYYGGGIKISPDSDLSDGRLDMVRVDALRRAEVALLLPRAYMGRHTGHRAVHITPFTRMTLRPAQSTLVHCDGDLWRVVDAGETLEVSVHPRALTCLAPAGNPGTGSGGGLH